MIAWMTHAGIVLTVAGVAWWTVRRARRFELGHALWLVVFAKLVVPPILDIPVLPAPATESPVVDPGDEARPVPTIGDGLDGTFVAGEASTTWRDAEGPLLVDPSLATPRGERSSITAAVPWSWILGIWGTGAVSYLAIVTFAAVRFGRRLRRRATPGDAELVAEFVRLADRIGLRRAPRLAVVDDGGSPLLWPFPATVVVPAPVLAALSADERRAVLLHELVHFARRDHLARGLELLVAAVWWWCPPIRWFRSELRFAEESACDARVLRMLDRGAGSTYAEALLKTLAVLASHGARHPLPAVASGAISSRTSERLVLTRRVTQIMRPNRLAPSRVPFRVLVAVAPLLLLFGPARAHGSPVSHAVNTSVQDPVRTPPPPPPEEEPQEVGEVEPVPLPQDAPFASSSVEPLVSDADRELLAKVFELVEAGELAQAAARLRVAIQADASPVLLFTLGNVLHRKSGATADAARAYREATEMFPQYRSAWRMLGLLRYEQGDVPGSVEALERAVELGAADASAYGLLGMGQLDRGDAESAERSLWMAHLMAPESRDWKLGLLRAMRAQKRHVDLVALTTKLMAEGDVDDVVRMVRAQSMIALGRRAEVRTELRTLTGETRRIDTLAAIGDMLASVEDHEGAVSAYLRLLEAEGKLPLDRLLRAARFLAAAGADEPLDRLLDGLRAVEPERLGSDGGAELLEMMARRSEQGADPDAALRELEQRIAVAPRDGTLRLRYARTLRQVGRFEDAIAQYQVAALDPATAADARVRHAQLLVEQQRYREAVPLLREAQEIEPRASVGRFLEQLETVEETRPRVSRQSVLIAVTADDQIVHAGREIGFDGVAPLVKRLLDKDPDLEVILQADRAVPAGALVRVIDAAKAAGAATVRISSGVVFDQDELDRRPRAVSQPSPIVSAALQEKAPGSVTLLFIVEADGRVGDVRVQDSSDPAFEKPAIEAVRKWKFEPGLRAGAPVRFRVRQRVSFPQR